MFLSYYFAEGRTCEQCGCLAEAIVKQSVEGEALLLLTAYLQNARERNDIKTDMLIKEEAELKHLKNSQPVCIGKMEANKQEKKLFRRENGCGQSRLGRIRHLNGS